jgi:anti-sigma B factor antagonist
MEITLEKMETTSFLRMIGQLWEKHDLQLLESALAELAPACSGRIVLDMSRLTFVSSQGLGVLVRVFMQAKKNHAVPIILHVPTSIAELFEVAGLNQYMIITHNERELTKELSAGSLPA